MLNDESKWRIESLVNSCKGACETGALLHELWSAYQAQSDYIKKYDVRLWNELQEEIRTKDLDTCRRLR